MKTYFNDQGALMIEPENNTDMVALKAWYKNYNPESEAENESCLGFIFDAHLQTRPTQGKQHE